MRTLSSKYQDPAIWLLLTVELWARRQMLLLQPSLAEVAFMVFKEGAPLSFFAFILLSPFYPF